jgi:hypothetical protein
MEKARNKKLEKEDESLKGALTSVMLLGFFLIGSWLSIYLLFLSR